MGFTSFKTDLDIRLCYSDDKYEYNAAYVDDIATRNPKQIVKALMGKYKFELRGTDPISFHLGIYLLVSNNMT